jgi:hypothetical protein
MRVALAAGAERLCALQRTDAGWEGSWRRYVGSNLSATNTVGLSALGLVEAFKVLHDESLLSCARGAAAFAIAHLGAGATPPPYHPRFTGADLLLLHRLHQVTGDEGYRIRAADEWRNIRSYFYFASALELHRFFQKIERQMGAWDLSFYLEAADLSGDTAWADGAAAVLADTLGGLYGERTNEYRVLNIAAAVRALSGQGYGAIHRADVEALSGALVEAVEAEALGPSIQDTAHVALALLSAGQASRATAGRLARILVARQEPWGGWMSAGVQYPHVVAEALWALATYRGKRGPRDRGPETPEPTIWPRGQGRLRAAGSHDPVAPFDGV